MILIDGMPVYCGGNLYDSDESDWEDPYDIACAEYVDQYNFDALEGMELHVFERINGPDESVMMVSERTGSKHVIQASSGYPRWELDTVSTEPVAHVFTGRHDVPDVAVSPNCRSCSETYGGGAALYYEGDISDSDCGSVEDRERDTWKDWSPSGVTLHLEMDTVRFRRTQTICCRRLCSVTNCFRMKILPICLYRIRRNCLCQHCRFLRMRGYLWSPLI